MSCERRKKYWSRLLASAKEMVRATINVRINWWCPGRAKR